jgi:hypothetical protein
MNCVCGHPEKDHVGGGGCRVPDCSCERFQPGDTLRPSADHAARPAGAAALGGAELQERRDLSHPTVSAAARASASGSSKR